MKASVILAAALWAMASPVLAAAGGGIGGRTATAQDAQIDAQNAALETRFREALGQAKAAYDRGDFSLARSLWRPAADANYPPAQYYLALMCERGQGAAPNAKEAAAWLSKAATLGFSPAEFGLGMAYLSGRGVPRDDGRAVKWLRLAADHGLAQAQFNLGVLYQNGQGVAKDPQAAAEWFQKAAAGGVK